MSLLILILHSQTPLAKIKASAHFESIYLPCICLVVDIVFKVARISFKNKLTRSINVSIHNKFPLCIQYGIFNSTVT